MGWLSTKKRGFMKGHNERHNDSITREGVLSGSGPSTLSRPRILFAPRGVETRFRNLFKNRNPLVRYFGVDFDQDLYAWVDDPSKAREFTSDYWNSPVLFKELEKETSKSDRDHIVALRHLRHAYIVDDEDAAREVLYKVGELCSFPDVLTNEPSWSSNRARVREVYPLILGSALQNARIRIWPATNGGFAPVIWCPDMTTAMYTYAAFNGVESCQNCAKLFCTDMPRIDGSRSERYCTVACGERFRQRLYRKRQKETKEDAR
jgi:hypothetical protein